MCIKSVQNCGFILVTKNMGQILSITIIQKVLGNSFPAINFDQSKLFIPAVQTVKYNLLN